MATEARLPTTERLTMATNNELNDLLGKISSMGTRQTAGVPGGPPPDAERATPEPRIHLGKRVIEVIAQVIANGDPDVQRAIDAKAAALRVELAGPDPSPLETLLVDRAIACWLEANQADLLVAGKGNLTNSQSEYYSKWQTRATKRFGKAAQDLAVVQKLQRKTLRSAQA